ncbi:hypothetical protein PF004_g3739 [Phytophthora fragariae]|uniref:Crinkler (CRN) family protein n=3 Tax=Phytophthora fragariae TaxID=53985 RepID=A0A6G0PKY8_9STRA|nr:hypothetical protein PF004_g3739 [Phytophthora fragariae]
MEPLLWIKSRKHFGENFQPGEGQVYVLVVPSAGATSAEVTESTKLSTLEMMLKQCKVSGDLPKEDDLPKLFEWTDDNCGNVMAINEIDDIVHFTGSKFYVRKEILCVLEIFMNVYQDEFDHDKVVNKQFILMGSPGTGKSCILALICFYVAVHYKRPVVWFRQVAGGLYPITTRLFYKGKYYEWEDAKGEIYETLYNAMGSSGIDPIKCWFCLDGITQDKVIEKGWFNQYKLLATSGQFSPKSGAVPFVKMCLVPYWRQKDLEDFGRNHMQMSDVDDRLFVSGGSLREFLSDDAKTTVLLALKEIEKPEHAKNLLTTIGIGSSKQIDRIRMQGVQDRNKAEHYVNVEKWASCVMSKFALQRMAAMMSPDFFETLMGIAKGMKDDRLEGVALEGHFHSSVRHQRSILVQYYKYDNVNRKTVHDWESIMRQEMGSIEVNGPSVVKCEGGNRKECVAVMESWASNPSEMDYWIPATSLCETIDAVAKWTLPGKVVRFCFLQLTKATIRKFDADVLWELAQPFVNRQLPVCYIALLPEDPDEDKRLRFRMNPVEVTLQTVLDHIPLYVAHFQVASQLTSG